VTQKLGPAFFWLSATTLWFFGIAFGFLPSNGAAQQAPAAKPPPDFANPPKGGNLPQAGLMDFFGGRTPYEFWLTVLIAVFGLAVVLLLLWHLRGVSGRKAEDVARPIVVVALITGALILVTAGYSNDQIAPAFGLFGTIAGYILGRLERPPAGGGGAAAGGGT
jgi:hypothetical protein